MKPARFAYERPTEIETALDLVAGSGMAARFLAGGQSLGPMLNLRLAQPDLLVDLTAIPDLKRVEERPDALVLGACITHADIEDGRVPDVTSRILPSVASGIAYRAIRNRGTIGGSVSHADPAGDWITCLAALGASIIARSRSGSRTVAIEDFVEGAFQTNLGDAEMVEAVLVPRSSATARWGYYKITRKSGDFADAMAAVHHDAERGVCRAVIGATDARPIILADAGTALFGGRPESGLAGSLMTAVVDDLLGRAFPDDLIARHLHLVALRRAAAMADA
jgi:aerobic carbon-monoxide dehydrogenase medium subunit